ncbi:unnamed protein product [Meloidogyne enterolobii]|uniref:Uncharacterized protein n=1 Tax=Meloidogyne enterolobii TaxID=390850 RepID=A0ACB0Z5D9_MELEN
MGKRKKVGLFCILFSQTYQGHVSAYLLVCGVDATGAYLFEVSASGGGFLKPFSADGSGCLCAIAELENGFKPDMTVF